MAIALGISMYVNIYSSTLVGCNHHQLWLIVIVILLLLLLVLVLL